MDPYINIDPDDHGEMIRKRVLERDGSDNLGRPAQRPRADTRDLLTTDDSEEVEESLMPEIYLTKDDHKRLQVGLKYVNGAAKRNITPCMQDFFKAPQRRVQDCSRREGISRSMSSCCASHGLGLLLLCVFP